MTTLLSFTAPENIGEFDWDELALQVKMVKAFQREQRETYFEDIVERLPDSAEPVFNSYMGLVPSFFSCREFHEYAKLPYHDPRDENGQIIRVALAAMLGVRVLRDNF